LFGESLTEFLLATDRAPASRTWYRSRLGAFCSRATTLASLRRVRVTGRRSLLGS